MLKVDKRSNHLVQIYSSMAGLLWEDVGCWFYSHPYVKIVPVKI